MVNENCKTPNRNNQKLDSEAVMVAIIGGPEFHVDQVDCGVRTSDVDHLGKQCRTEQIMTEGTEERKCSHQRAVLSLTFMHVLYSEMNEESRSK